MTEEVPPTVIEAMKIGDTAHITGKAQSVNTHDLNIPGRIGEEVFEVGTDLNVNCMVIKVELPSRCPGATEGAMFPCFQMLYQVGQNTFERQGETFLLPTAETVITPTTVTVRES